MVKNSIIFIIFITFIDAKSSSINLEKTCLSCHTKQKIPSELIYRRYLMKYSDSTIIKNRILEYLKHPIQKNSIMPKQFFLKFPMKNRTDLNQTILYQEVEEYINFFDIKKKLVLPSDINKN